MIFLKILIIDLKNLEDSTIVANISNTDALNNLLVDLLLLMKAF
jgi:hypothetical protein